MAVQFGSVLILNARLYVLITAALFLSLSGPVGGFIAYECDAKSEHIEAINGVHLPPCSPSNKTLKTEGWDIQVLQRREIAARKVISCLVRLTRHITYCGMHSRSSEVLNGHSQEIIELSREQCEAAFHSRAVWVRGELVAGLTINATTVVPITLAGKATSDGQCKGGSYREGLLSWDSVYVHGFVEATLAERWASVRLSDKKLIFNNGITCPYGEGRCMDSIMGNCYWEGKDITDCDPDGLYVLYEGAGEYIVDSRGRGSVLVRTPERSFSLRLTNEVDIRNRGGYNTEYSQIVVVRRQAGVQPFYRNRAIDTRDVNLVLALDSKISFLVQCLLYLYIIF